MIFTAFPFDLENSLYTVYCVGGSIAAIGNLRLMKGVPVIDSNRKPQPFKEQGRANCATALQPHTAPSKVKTS